MFDPEKVERYEAWDAGSHDTVRASDYDQLLELYRKTTPEMYVFYELIEGLAPIPWECYKVEDVR